MEDSKNSDFQSGSYSSAFTNDSKETMGIFSKTVQTESVFGSGFEEANELFATMGLQMEYTDELAQKHDNRSIEAVQFIDVDDSKIREITQNLIKEYGEDSKQVHKWLEQLKKIEMYKQLQARALKQRKKQSIFAVILIAIGVSLVALCVLMLMNSTSYYVNLGDYNHIYKKTMFGTPESISDVMALYIEKKGGDIYYIEKNSQELYRMDLKTKKSEHITHDKAEYFEISGKTIFYINASDGSKLYSVPRSGGESVKVMDEECSELTLKNGKLSVKTASGEECTVNTRTNEITMSAK